ncbi:hypothetical protein ACFQU1_05065 [Chelatococcus sp. GCM10030263]|uniref:hypothetical protein n=1 Tax=Chelatococcus sp. GCM10030263 TaxID=3273387 RepID=UPI00360DC101
MTEDEFEDLWARAAGGDVAMAKAAVYAALLHTPIRHRRRADSLVLAFMATTLSVAGLATGLGLWFATTASPALPAVVGYQIGGATAAVPREWLRLPASRPGPVEHLELALSWPEQPSRSALRERAMGQSAPDDLILVTVSAADNTLSPSDRLAKLYMRFLDPKPAAGPAGLLSYTFREGTRYAGEQLYVTAAGFGTSGEMPFYARCPAPPAREQRSGASGPCMTSMRIGPFDIVVRFASERLEDWPRLADGIARIVATMVRR